MFVAVVLGVEMTNIGLSSSGVQLQALLLWIASAGAAVFSITLCVRDQRLTALTTKDGKIALAGLDYVDPPCFIAEAGTTVR